MLSALRLSSSFCRACMVCCMERLSYRHQREQREEELAFQGKRHMNIRVCVCTRAYVCVTHSFQLLVARAEPLPLAGDDGEQRVHLALRKLRLGAHT